MTDTTVRRYPWDRGLPSARHGALITVEGRGRFFVPAEDILDVATGLADVLQELKDSHRTSPTTTPAAPCDRAH